MLEILYREDIPQSDSYVKALSLHYEKCNPKRGQEKERNGQIAGRKVNIAETDYRDEAARHVGCRYTSDVALSLHFTGCQIEKALDVFHGEDRGGDQKEGV